MLRSLLFASAALAALLAPAAAQDWPAPGDGFAWERVGTPPHKTIFLDLDDEGTLWGGGSTKVKRLDHPDDPSDVWHELGPLVGTGPILALGRGDTVLTAGTKLRITRDRGVTWEDVLDDGKHRIVETTAPGPAGPAGTLLAAEWGLWRSLDRGASWSLVPFEGVSPFQKILDVLPFPPAHPLAGELLAVGNLGAWRADTTASGALQMRAAGQGPTLVIEHTALMPSGRVVATGFYSGSGSNLSFTSDDGGETWTDGPALPEPADGIPGDAWLAVVGPGQALAAGGRGIVYATSDDGETWAVVGRTPVTEDILISQDLLIDGEGRLLVAMMRAGPEDTGAGVFRTSTAVVVASGAGAPSRAALGVRVAPNPSAGDMVTVDLMGDGSVRAWVVDAVGRRVAALWAGELRGVRSVALDVSGWAAGVYTVVVVEAEGVRRATAFTVAR